MTIASENIVHCKALAVPHASIAIERTCFWFLIALPLTIVSWWAWMLIHPPSQQHFWPPNTPTTSIYSSSAADLLIVGCSIAAAFAIRWKRRSARALLWLTFGALAYPSIACVAVAIQTHQAIAAAVAMGGAALGMLAVSTAHEIAQRQTMLPIFRFAKSRSTRSHRFFTLLQICVFWPTLLVLFPCCMSALDTMMGWPRFESILLKITGLMLFASVATVNLWAAWVMTGSGDGTPFPYQMTRKLVLSGPYQFIRNPMAATGLIQGIAVSIWLGSYLAILYVICGGLIWQYLVRPIEEQMLFELFGAEYAEYRARVPCWLPKLSGETNRTTAGN